MKKNNHPYASIMYKCREMILLLNVHLNHFPNHEKYGLCQSIRQAAYDVYGMLVECGKRYVDDFILFNLTRAEAIALRLRIEAWLAENLGLELSHWTIQPTRRGVNFVGFRTWRSTRYVRKHSLYRFSKSLRRGDVASLNSIIGNARQTSSLAHLRQRVLRERPDLVHKLFFGD